MVDLQSTPMLSLGFIVIEIPGPEDEDHSKPCVWLDDRSGTNNLDGFMDRAYAEKLARQCRRGAKDLRHDSRYVVHEVCVPALPDIAQQPERDDVREAIAWLRGDGDLNEPNVGPRSRKAIDVLLAHLDSCAQSERNALEAARDRAENGIAAASIPESDPGLHVEGLTGILRGIVYDITRALEATKGDQ